MRIESEVISQNDSEVICRVMVEDEQGKVSVMGTSQIIESGRYVELAQARALKLAYWLLQNDIADLDEHEFITESMATMSPTPAATLSEVDTTLTPPPLQFDFDPVTPAVIPDPTIEMPLELVDKTAAPSSGDSAPSELANDNDQSDGDELFGIPY